MRALAIHTRRVVHAAQTARGFLLAGRGVVQKPLASRPARMTDLDAAALHRLPCVTSANTAYRADLVYGEGKTIEARRHAAEDLLGADTPRLALSR